jgi:hypothetical protein
MHDLALIQLIIARFVDTESFLRSSETDTNSIVEVPRLVLTKH